MRFIICFIFFFSNFAFSNEHNLSSGAKKEARALVVATEKVQITSEISARVDKIHYQMGEPFKKGDVLLSFDCKLFESQRDVIKSNLDSAKIQLQNDQELYNLRAIGEMQYQLTVSNVKKAEAEFKIAQLNVDRCNILAPYNGKVMQVHTNIFARIEERQPLMDIVGDGLLEAEILVPSMWLNWLKKGHAIQILIDETGKTLDATITHVGATVDAVSQTIALKAQFNKKYESLIAGMSGVAFF